MLSTLLGKLKKGKGLPDGAAAEMYDAVPADAKAAVAQYLVSVILTLKIPSEWCLTFVAFLAIVVGADSLAKLRPITSLPTIRELLE